MRSTSVKTAVVAVTLAAVTAIAVPAYARPTQGRSNSSVSQPGLADRHVVVMKRLYNSILAPIANGVPVIPLPPPDEQDTNSSTTKKPAVE